MILQLTSCVALVLSTKDSIPTNNLTIGAIVLSGDGRIDGVRGLQLGVDYVNSLADLLPNVTLSLKVETVASQTDRFGALQAACRLLQNDSKVVVVIGPSSSTTVKAANPVFAGLHIPQIAPTATDPALSLGGNFPFLIKMAPPDDVQSQAVFDLIRAFGWSHAVVIHSGTDYGRNGLKAFISKALEWGMSVSRIQAIDVRADISLTKASIRRSLREIRKSGVRVVVVHAHLEVGSLVLREARNMQLFQAGYSWIVTDGMTAELDYQENPDRKQNVGLCLSDYSGLIGTSPVSDRGRLLSKVRRFAGQSINRAAMALVDSVLTAAYALHDYIQAGHNVSAPAFPSAICRNGSVQQWQNGHQLFSYMRKVKGDGTQTYIDFTEANYRRDTRYDILNMRDNRWLRIGTWNAPGNLTLTGKPIFSGATAKVPTDIILDLRHMTFRISTVMEIPFVMTASNGELEGFCVDLATALRKTLGFNYTLHISEDGMYGAKDALTGRWNGVIGEIVTGKADMGIGSLTISSHREQVVDFTTPFVDVGIDVLLPKEGKQDAVFQFLQPFDLGMWLWLLLATYLCGILISLCSLLSPFGYRGRHTQRRDASSSKHRRQASELHRDNGIWFAVASLLNQSPDRFPASLSGRVMALSWWTIVTITIAFYTAKLTALLTVETIDMGISSIEDLIAQSNYRYGASLGTSMETSFRETNVEPYHEMTVTMDQHNTWVKSMKEGVDLVRQAAQDQAAPYKFAMIFDSPFTEYWALNEPCVTRAMKNHIRKHGFGIAMRKSSPYTEEFSTAILNLRESGTIAALYRKWITGPCKQESDVSEASGGATLPFTRSRGVFYTFYIGMLLSAATLALEYALAAYADVVRDRLEQKDVVPCWSYHGKRRLKATLQAVRGYWDSLLRLRKSYDLQRSRKTSERHEVHEEFVMTRRPSWNENVYQAGAGRAPVRQYHEAVPRTGSPHHPGAARPPRP